MSEDFEREPVAVADKGFDPTKVSATRVNKLAECGVAFKMKYLDRVPEQRMGSFALFGSVVHEALEKWAVNREQDLLALMRQAWLSQTAEATVVRDFLAEYQKINVAVLHAEKAAREAFEKRNNKPSQAPRMTKHFKESKAAKDLARLLAVWIPKLDADSPWEFSSRDPLPQFYDDSLVIAKRYERRWKHLPPALHTEFAFDVPWRGFRLIGYIDVIELLMTAAGELFGFGVKDYKTYRREPAEQKDYRQLVMYDVALRYLVNEGVIALPASLDSVPLYVGIDYVRYADVECDWKVLVPEGKENSGGNSVAWWKIGEADHDRLERELRAYRGTVEAENFLPADKGQNAEFCDYGSLCCQRSCEAAGGSAIRVEVPL